MPEQTEQTELECVSCETTFDPAPNGGFCPDCDTPHPDYDLQDDDATDEDDAAATDGAADADAEATEAEDAADDDADESTETEDAADDDADEETEDAADDDADEEAEDEASDEVECGSCGSAVDASASFCPNCGGELGAEEESRSLVACPDCGSSIGDESYCPDCGTHLDPIRAGEASAGDVPAEVTLVVAGEEYTFGDGDTFGRQDASWLNDLVAASGGREAATYVSGDHLEFSVEDDGVYVTDVSTNGTKHNGEALDGASTKLEDGDTLLLADRAEVEVKL